MTLRVMLRLTPTENLKKRPEWYSKEICLRSVLAAVDTAREAGLSVELLAFVDVSSGLALSPGVARLLERVDALMPLEGGTAVKSWRPVIRTVRDKVLHADDDLLYFVEDDYLHHPDSLLDLVAGTADYRMLYAPEDENFVTGPEHDGWAPIDTSTSSFAVTGAVFRRDTAFHLFFSYGGGIWDELSWRALGGLRVNPPALPDYVLYPFTAASQWPRKWGVRPIRNAVFRGLALLSGRTRSRLIEVRLPMSATHGERLLLASGSDWAALAETYAVATEREQAEAFPHIFFDARPPATVVGDALPTALAEAVVYRLVAPCSNALTASLGKALAGAGTWSVILPDARGPRARD
ncbi:hypothetical protein ACVLV4_002568 [Rathayibacter agropyri]